MPAVRTRPGVQPSIRLRAVPALDPPFDDESASPPGRRPRSTNSRSTCGRGAKVPARADPHAPGCRRPGRWSRHRRARDRSGPAGAPAAAGPGEPPPAGPRPTAPACRPPRWRSRPTRRSRRPTGSSAGAWRSSTATGRSGTSVRCRPRRRHRGPGAARGGRPSVHRAGDAPAPPGAPDLRTTATGLRATPRRRRDRRRAGPSRSGLGVDLAPRTAPGQLGRHHGPAAVRSRARSPEPGGPAGVPLPGALTRKCRWASRVSKSQRWRALTGVTTPAPERRKGRSSAPCGDDDGPSAPESDQSPPAGAPWQRLYFLPGAARARRVAGRAVPTRRLSRRCGAPGRRGSPAGRPTPSAGAWASGSLDRHPGLAVDRWARSTAAPGVRGARLRPLARISTG